MLQDKKKTVYVIVYFETGGYNPFLFLEINYEHIKTRQYKKLTENIKINTQK